jgi:hypothetical protein
MKEYKTCEEYVLSELAEREKRIANLSDENCNLRTVITNFNELVYTLKHFLTIRRAADGRSVIDMKLIFEEFDPEAFALVKEAFELKEVES